MTQNAHCYMAQTQRPNQRNDLGVVVPPPAPRPKFLSSLVLPSLENFKFVNAHITLRLNNLTTHKLVLAANPNIGPIDYSVK
jgi:hypothetical protein